MIYKNVKNASNNLKDGGSLLQRIVVVDNSPIMWLYLCYSRINGLIPQNTKQYNDQGWTNQLTSHDVINLSLILYSFPVAGTFVKGKKQFSDRQSSWNFLGDKFKTVRIVNYTNLKTKVSLCF